MRKFKATDLVVDFELYPRGDVDSQHISYMVRSLEAGHSLPPIIIDEKTRKIVDGVHRWHAWRKWSGKEDIEIECVEKRYQNEANLFVDAVRLNASHGAALTTFDRAKCLLRAEELKINPEDIADALGMTIERAGALRQGRAGHLRVASIDGTSVVAFGKDQMIPLKRTIRHMSGRTLTKKQAEINEHLGGMEALYYVNQLLMLIDGDLIDLSDERLANGLDKLSKAISQIKIGKV